MSINLKKIGFVLKAVMWVVLIYAEAQGMTVVTTMKEIYPFLEKLSSKDLVVFDIDNVILVPKDQAVRPCGRELRHYHWEQIRNTSPKNYSLYRKIAFEQLNFELVDPEILRVLEYLRRRNINVIALTAFSDEPFLKKGAERRVQLLESMGVQFDTIQVTRHPLLTPFLQIKGVVFTRKKPKGEVLKSFLQATQLNPDRLVFIDDKKANLESVQESLESRTPLDLLHFKSKNLADSTKLDSQMVAKQFEHLKNHRVWLSDKQISAFTNHSVH